jgi:hypothetical protein
MAEELPATGVPFTEAGSIFEGPQAGYNRMLPNRVVLGAEGT